MRTKLAALILPLAVVTLVACRPVAADFITNGGFEQFAGGYNNLPSQLANSSTNGYTALTGWTVGSGTYGFLMSPGTADTTGSHSPQFNNTFTLWGSNNGGLNILPASSPHGGNYVALDAADGYRGTGISQVINGLVVGKQYAVTFDWASGQQHGYDGITTEALQVSLGSQVQSTSTVTNVSHGFTNWQQQTFVFTAAGASQTLNFMATGTPSGLPPMVLLDGVSFGAVPEPASIALLGIGIVGSAVVQRCRRRNPAQM